MTKETEYYLRQEYELWTRDGLLDHIIELQKKIEILENRGVEKRQSVIRRIN